LVEPVPEFSIGCQSYGQSSVASVARFRTESIGQDEID
ncbi:MAG: hypothetical protein ACI8P0_003038, partial [Planctomycetaceae bacterium]